jgi:hypothetical protein
LVQSPSLAHGLLQPPAVQAYGAQSFPFDVWQLPRPSHWFLAMMLPSHVEAAHVVPWATSVHAPPPLHVPVRPQVPGCAGHCARGSTPDFTGAQVPLEPPVFVPRQDTHVPLQAESQQTPSLVQFPVEHSLQAPPLQSAAWHAAPLAF